MSLAVVSVELESTLYKPINGSFMTKKIPFMNCGIMLFNSDTLLQDRLVVINALVSDCIFYNFWGLSFFCFPLRLDGEIVYLRSSWREIVGNITPFWYSVSPCRTEKDPADEPIAYAENQGTLSSN